MTEGINTGGDIAFIAARRIIVETKAGASAVCALPLFPNKKSRLKVGIPLTNTKTTIKAQTAKAQILPQSAQIVRRVRHSSNFWRYLPVSRISAHFFVLFGGSV